MPAFNTADGVEDNQYCCGGINFSDFILIDAFINDGGKFFSVVAALRLKIGEIGLFQVFPFPVAKKVRPSATKSTCVPKVTEPAALKLALESFTGVV